VITRILLRIIARRMIGTPLGHDKDLVNAILSGPVADRIRPEDWLLLWPDPPIREFVPFL
jgi:hypothetical protein